MRIPARGLPLPILFVLLLAPPGAAGQELPRATDAVARGGVRVTSLRGERTLLVGGAGLLRVSPTFAFGGGGWVLTEVLELDGGEIGGGLGLRVAYGGIQALATPWWRNGVRVQIGALVGAGNAKIVLPAVGAEIAADNFLVFEPEVSVDVRMRGPLWATMGVGYRAVTGVEDLAGVTAGQLKGGIATVGLVIGH